MIGYLILMFVIGWTVAIRPVCPAGYRAISVDGSRSKVPKTESDIVTPDQDYPICSPMLSCPLLAFHPDGSSLTSSCVEPGCPCTSFMHCPAYSSTLFRSFGEDERISMFQIIDPSAKDASHGQDPYDVPYLLTPGSRDACFLSSTTIDMVWPPMKLGDQCLRGTLAKIKNNQSLFVCAPTSFVSESPTDGFVFDVDAYMTAYRT